MADKLKDTYVKKFYENKINFEPWFIISLCVK